MAVNNERIPTKKDVINAIDKFNERTPVVVIALSLNASKFIVIMVKIVAIIPIKTKTLE